MNDGDIFWTSEGFIKSKLTSDYMSLPHRERILSIQRFIHDELRLEEDIAGNMDSSPYLISAIRSEKSFGSENILMTFDTSLYSTLEGLKLLYHFKFSPLNWLNKDVIIVFYENIEET
jgi:hypothetical protein